MRLAGHVTRTGEERKVYKVLVERHHSEDLGVDPRLEDGFTVDLAETGLWCGVD
jgi:hypothetical protein